MCVMFCRRHAKKGLACHFVPLNNSQIDACLPHLNELFCLKIHSLEFLHFSNHGNGTTVLQFIDWPSRVWTCIYHNRSHFITNTFLLMAYIRLTLIYLWKRCNRLPVAYAYKWLFFLKHFLSAKQNQRLPVQRIHFEEAIQVNPRKVKRNHYETPNFRCQA